jgi:hypothetical protein
MAPTPEQLIINPQTINVQTPQVQEQITQAPQYVEGEVSMPSPQQWIGNINYGLDWYALGSKAFGVAGNIYEELQKYGLRRRKEYAQDDMNKIQAISVEKPDPSFNDYQIEDFYKAQSKKLRQSTREALKRQGFSDYNIDRILPSEGDSTFEPSELALPASDMDSLLGFTRYFDLTNQEFSNQIIKYNEINWQNSKESYLDGVKRSFGAIDGKSPYEVKQMYDNRFTEMQDNAQGKPERQRIVDEYKQTPDYKIALESAIANATDSVLNDYDKEIVGLYQQLASGQITQEQYVTIAERLEEKRERELLTISSIDPTVNPVAPIEQRKKERLTRNPNGVYEFKVAQLERIDEQIKNISLILANAGENTDYKTIEDLTLTQKRLIDQKVNHISDIYKNTNKVFLNKDNQASYSKIETVQATLVQQQASEQEKSILEKAVEKGVIDYNTTMKNFDSLLSGIVNWRQQTGRKTPPTATEFLSLVGKQESELSLEEKYVYSVLSDKESYERLSSIDSSSVINYLRNQLQTEYLHDYHGISIGPHGEIKTKYQVDRKVYEHAVQQKITNQQTSISTRNAQAVVGEKEDTDNFAQDTVSKPFSLSQSELQKHTPEVFRKILAEKKTPASYWGIFKLYEEKSAKEISFSLQDPLKRERFFEAATDNIGSVNRQDMLDWARKASLSDDPEVLKTARFISWTARKLPSRFDLTPVEQSKLDPKIQMQEFEQFEKTYDTALRQIQQADPQKGSKQLASLLQFARTRVSTGVGRFGDLEGMEAFPNFDNNLEAWVTELGGEYDMWFDDNQTKNLIVNSEEGLDLISPIILATMGSSPNESPEKIVELAKHFSDMMGVRVKKVLDKEGNPKTILSRDLYGYTDRTSLMPTEAQVPWVVSENTRTIQTLENISYGAYPSYMRRDGKPFIPTTEEEKKTFSVHDKEFMLGYVAAAMPGVMNVNDVQAATELMGVLDPLFEVYSQNLSIEERKKIIFEDPRIKRWVYIDQEDMTQPPKPIAQSRIKALNYILNQPQLTARTMVEIGLNSQSHISEADKQDPVKRSQRRIWRPIESYRMEFTRNSDYRDELDGVMQPSSLSYTTNNVEVAQPNAVEPVILYDPQTGERVNLNPFPPVNIGSNSLLEKPFQSRIELPNNGSVVTDDWIENHRGQVWIMVDTRGNFIYNQKINERNLGENLTEDSLQYDPTSKSFIYIVSSTTPEGLTGEIKRKVLPYRLQKQADEKVTAYPVYQTSPDFSKALSENYTQDINYNGMPFKFESTTSLRKTYEKIYGPELAAKLIAEAKSNQNNTSLIETTGDSMYPTEIARAAIPNYNEEQLDTKVPIYRYNGDENKDLNPYGFIFDNKVYLSKRVGSGDFTVIHELTHNAQSKKLEEIPLTQNLGLSKVKSFTDGLQENATQEQKDAHRYIGYFISPRELPAHIAEYKAEYYKQKQRTLTASNLETELPKFIEWLKSKSRSEKNGREHEVFADILENINKSSPLYKVILETMKQVAFNNIDDNTTRLV